MTSSVTNAPPVPTPMPPAPLVAASASSIEASPISKFCPFSRILEGNPMCPKRRLTVTSERHIQILREVFFYLNDTDRRTAAAVETAFLHSRLNAPVFRALIEGRAGMLERRMENDQVASWEELEEHEGLTGHFFTSPKISHVNLKNYLTDTWNSRIGFEGAYVNGLFENLFRAFPNLESLDLTGCNLSDNELQSLNICLQSRTINALDSLIRMAGTGTSLAQAVNRCKTAYEIKDPAFPQRLQEVMDMCHTDAMKKLVLRCRGLVKLDFSNNSNITNAALEEVIQNCPYLQNLILNKTEISFRILEHIGRHCPRLKRFHAMLCLRFREQCFLEIFARRCQWLEELDLRGSLSSSMGVIALSRHCSRLKYFAARDISEEAILALACNCQDLEQLVLEGRRVEITAPSIRVLAEECKRLKKVSFKGAYCISGQDIRRFAEGCPTLKEVIFPDSTSWTREEIFREIPAAATLPVFGLV